MTNGVSVAEAVLACLDGPWRELAARFDAAQALETVAAMALIACAAAFLLLVRRISWAARQFVTECRERQRAQQRMLNLLGQYLENAADREQLWSAASALSPC